MPNSNYLFKIRNEQHVHTVFSGSSEKINQLAEMGYTNPLSDTGVTEIIFRVSSSEKQPDGRILVVINLENPGFHKPEDSTKIQVAILGMIDRNNNLSLWFSDSLHESAQGQEMPYQVIIYYLNQLHFPVTFLKDSEIVRKTMSMTFSGRVDDIGMKIMVSYKLGKIDDEFIEVNSTETITPFPDSLISDNKFVSTGEGILRYNRISKRFDKYVLTTIITSTVYKDELKLDISKKERKIFTLEQTDETK